MRGGVIVASDRLVSSSVLYTQRTGRHISGTSTLSRLSPHNTVFISLFSLAASLLPRFARATVICSPHGRVASLSASTLSLSLAPHVRLRLRAQVRFRGASNTMRMQACQGLLISYGPSSRRAST